MFSWVIGPSEHWCLEMSRYTLMGFPPLTNGLKMNFAVILLNVSQLNHSPSTCAPTVNHLPHFFDWAPIKFTEPVLTRVENVCFPGKVCENVQKSKDEANTLIRLINVQILQYGRLESLEEKYIYWIFKFNCSVLLLDQIFRLFSLTILVEMTRILKQ